MARTIEQQIKATYFALRVGAAVIAFVFPLLLWAGGQLAGFSLPRLNERLLLGNSDPALPVRRESGSFLQEAR